MSAACSCTRTTTSSTRYGEHEPNSAHLGHRVLSVSHAFHQPHDLLVRQRRHIRILVDYSRSGLRCFCIASGRHLRLDLRGFGRDVVRNGGASWVGGDGVGRHRRELGAGFLWRWRIGMGGGIGEVPSHRRCSRRTGARVVSQGDKGLEWMEWDGCDGDCSLSPGWRMAERFWAPQFEHVSPAAPGRFVDFCLSVSVFVSVSPSLYLHFLSPGTRFPTLCADGVAWTRG
jgi:hypothetical protein